MRRSRAASKRAEPGAAPYHDSSHPERAVWQQRVRSFDEERQRQEEARQMQEASQVNQPDAVTLPKLAEDGNGGGVVNVGAYTRDDKKGPVHVSAHQRSAPD